MTKKPAHPHGGVHARELSTCVCFSMRKAARAITQLYDGALADTGLRITQFSILGVLYAHGRPRRMGDLAHDLVMDRTTLTRNLRPLERAGYVTLDQGTDKRERLAVITADGVSLLEGVLPRWRIVQEEAQALFGEGRWSDLRTELAGAVERALEDPAGGARTQDHPKPSVGSDIADRVT